MTEERYRRATGLFHLLSHRARLRILDELRRGAACVCHLQTLLHRSQPYVSQQLRVLREAGIVTARREGPNVYYWLTDRRVRRLLEEALGPAGEAGSLPGCTCPCCRGECDIDRNAPFVSLVGQDL